MPPCAISFQGHVPSTLLEDPDAVPGADPPSGPQPSTGSEESAAFTLGCALMGSSPAEQSFRIGQRSWSSAAEGGSLHTEPYAPRMPPGASLCWARWRRVAER